MRKKHDEIRLPDHARPLHLRIAGEPRSGKTRLAAWIAYCDVRREFPTIILDGNGGLIDDTIGLILQDPQREKILSRLVYASMTAERVHTFPFFDYEEGRSAFDNADTLIEAVHRMTPPEYEIMATTMKHYGMTSCIALYEAGLATGVRFQPIEAVRFLQDKNFRSVILRECRARQPDIDQFYQGEYNQMPAQKQREEAFSFLSKLYPFVYNQTLRAVVGADRVTVPFREIEEKRLILAIDLSRLSDQAIFLIGSAFVNRFSRYLFSHPTRERPVSFIVDEAASLLAYPGMARDFREFQSRARAFKLWMTIVHQNMHQLEDDLREGLWSVGSQFVFRLLNVKDAQEAAENLIAYAPEKAKLPEGAEKVVGMPALEQARFDANAIQRLRDREGIFRRPILKRHRLLRTEETVWQTSWVKVPEISTRGVTEAMVEEVKRRSLAAFARPRSEVLAEIERRSERVFTIYKSLKQPPREKA